MEQLRWTITLPLPRYQWTTDQFGKAQRGKLDVGSMFRRNAMHMIFPITTSPELRFSGLDRVVRGHFECKLNGYVHASTPRSNSHVYIVPGPEASDISSSQGMLFFASTAI